MIDTNNLTVDNAMEYLSTVASTLAPEHQALVNAIFTDPAFAVAPGSTRFHHDYLGGLALHTAEVVRNCLKLAGVSFQLTHTVKLWGDAPALDVPSCMYYQGSLNLPGLLVAAMLHDYCKTLEYSYELETVWVDVPDCMGTQALRQRIKPGSIKGTEYRDRIGHVFGGAAGVLQEGLSTGMDADFIMSVVHIMLAHHGRTEWRSPVEPKTPEAWILHAADMLSAQPGA